jgi:ABC-2 type transport system permease protein
MIRAIRSQWTKLTRPTFLWSTMIASAAFAVLATVVSILSADEPSSATAPGTDQVTTATLQHADGIVHGVGDATQFLGIVAVVVFAFSVASEYSYGTLRNLLVRQPRRLVLLGGSYLAMAAFVALAAVLATVVTAGVSLALAPSNGIDTAAWTSGSHLITEPLKAAANTSLAMIGYGTLGAALGIVLRSPAAAIGAGVAYLLPVETILSGALSGLDGWLPGKVLSAVASGGTDSVGYAHALIISAFYAAAAAIICVRIFQTRDVAS